VWGKWPAGEGANLQTFGKSGRLGLFVRGILPRFPLGELGGKTYVPPDDLKTKPDVQGGRGKPKDLFLPGFFWHWLVNRGGTGKFCRFSRFRGARPRNRGKQKTNRKPLRREEGVKYFGPPHFRPRTKQTTLRGAMPFFSLGKRGAPPTNPPFFQAGPVGRGRCSGLLRRPFSTVAGVFVLQTTPKNGGPPGSETLGARQRIPVTGLTGRYGTTHGAKRQNMVSQVVRR